MKFLPLENTNTSIWAPLIRLIRGWTTEKFPSVGSIWIATLQLEFFKFRVDASNLSMGYTSTSSSYWGHSSADGISPLGGPNHNFDDEISLTQSRRIQSVDGWYPPLQTSFQFAGKHSGEPLLHETYDIYIRVFLFGLSPQYTSFMWLEVGDIKNIRKA